MRNVSANQKPAKLAAQAVGESHFLGLSSGKMHYVDQGAGDTDRTLLFVHGNPTWCYHWRRLISQFQADYRCVAMDHLGMGLSDMPTSPLRLADHIQHVVHLIDALDLRRVTLVAQDWGGAIGLGSLLERVDRFERIVLFNTGAFPPPAIPRRIAVCRLPLVGRLAVQGLNAFSRAALTMTLARRDRLPHDVAEAYLAPYDNWAHRRGVYDFVADIPRTPRHPTWEALQQIEQRLPELARLPSCLIWGMRDWCFTPACLERFVQVWRDAEVHRLPDVGHWVVEDAPQEASELVAQFLASAAPAEATP